MQQALEFSQREKHLGKVRPLALLVEWRPWWPQFLNNLADLFRPPLPSVPLSSAPGKFWPDVFVDRSISWKNFGKSGFLHVAAILFVGTTGRFWLGHTQTIIEDPYQHTTLSYYKVDDLLPAVKLAPALRKNVRARKGQPEFARQEIISVPAAADNSTQTIINPPHPDILRRDVPLPNIVVSTPAPAPPTISLSKSQINLPTLAITPVQPTPDVRNARSARILEIAAPAVVQPAMEAAAVKRKLSDVNMARAQIDPVVEAPKLPLPEATAKAAPPQTEVIPPPPSAQSLSGGPKAAGQLIALSVRPAPPAAEIKVPDASRAGVFAATPTGKPGAPGTPEVPASTGMADADADGKGDSPITLSIGGPRLKPGTAAIVSGPTVLPPPKPAPSPDDKKRLLAAAAPPAFADFARRQTPPLVPSEERKPEDAVFAGKKFYSMQLNMPNLTSAGGSWIIRFAELKQNVSAGELSTPVATSKVDPAYPADLIHDHVEGIVILYAIIHADGTVGDVRVLQGFHEKLDENARVALSRWHFRPAMKNGLPVDLEAVVQIPFKTRRTGF